MRQISSVVRSWHTTKISRTIVQYAIAIGCFFIGVCNAYANMIVTCGGVGGKCNNHGNWEERTLTISGSTPGNIPIFSSGSEKPSSTYFDHAYLEVFYIGSMDGVTTIALDMGEKGISWIDVSAMPKYTTHLDPLVNGAPWASIDYYLTSGKFHIQHRGKMKDYPYYCIAANFGWAKGPPYYPAYIAEWGSSTYSFRGTEMPQRPMGCLATAPTPQRADRCTVSPDNVMNVELGLTERESIPTTSGMTRNAEKTFAINCEGHENHAINVKLAMTPTPWSNGQIATSNPTLGVSMSADGKLLNNNDSFLLNVNGRGVVTLGFSLLRDPRKSSTDIATGKYSASATLIVTEP
ncbi:Uncharacterised protein [Serratia fonticola]|uniref:fimbrial protein n=1 Tax=Serratia fonticola TaxID=47917 RepID=UPI00217BD98A|nr:fimbrial protein [Serratia fonticola]CAI2045153.1 Uncharacterised protein [Serratia fonticola]